MLIQLCSADGVTGFEGHAAAAAKKLLTPYCDKVALDPCGSVLGWKSCGKPGAKTVLLDAHLDQIGFMVTDVLEGGFLRFTQVGGIDPRMLLGAEVTILTDEPRYGVIACMPPHLLAAEEQNKAVPMHEMLIDTGLLDAKKVIPIGTPVVFAQPPYELAKGQVTGKCLDDRAGFVAIVEAMRKLKDADLNVDIVVCGSVHEETDSLGALAASFRVAPDYGIAVDVSHAKTPDSGSAEAFAFGDGALIGMGPNLHRGLANALMKTARAEEIPYEIEVMEGNTGTNAWEMQVVRSGIAMGLLSIPLKYMHTPIETIQLSDVNAVSDLLAAFLKHFDGEVARK
ncbi:MAG: M20/M25/M40 family metallo-hydrolase [Eubacteriales bacterium]|nr:M20/M25/M40 family metallo-hydrolase [Eubacteriales bacterium]